MDTSISVRENETEKPIGNVAEQEWKNVQPERSQFNQLNVTEGPEE